MTQGDEDLAKYFAQRYRLFSRYDEGIRLDHVGWYSATPELIAAHHAHRLRPSHTRPDATIDVVIDAFAGVGANSIQLALRDSRTRVIAVECDAARLELARHNANVYGVAHRIEFVCADFVALLESNDWPRLAPHEALTSVFLSPPWGGPAAVSGYGRFSLHDIVLDGGHSFIDVFHRVRARLSRNLAVFLPRNVDQDDLIELTGNGNVAELEEHRLSSKLKAVTVYFGALVDRELLVRDLNR
jgi:trimethylguanosine synthase